jgi:hypothetical protein
VSFAFLAHRLGLAVLSSCCGAATHAPPCCLSYSDLSESPAAVSSTAFSTCPLKNSAVCPACPLTAPLPARVRDTAVLFRLRSSSCGMYPFAHTCP